MLIHIIFYPGSQMLVKDLTENQLEKICVSLDGKTTSGQRKYKYIAEDKLRNLQCEEWNRIINDLSNSNVGMEFLNVLMSRNMDLTCSGFCTVASNLKRGDIKGFLEGKGEQKLREINLNDKTNLASMLSQHKTGVMKGWRHFADKFGFEKEDKDAIANNSSTNQSPSMTLLTQHDAFTGMPLSELKALCEKYSFTETANMIGNMMVTQL